MTDTTSPVGRPIRSFVLRQGRMSIAQQRAYDQLQSVYGITYTPQAIDLNATYQRNAPKILEIGFGMGDATATIAAEHPENDYLGIEVHGPGVGSLLNQIEHRELHNLRIVQHDAVEVLRDMIPDHSLAGVHIFFPDPWHKKRHNKRRLIKPEFVALISQKLAIGGYLHCATDWEDYAIQILQVLSDEPTLINTATDYAPRPDYRPLTKFEQRGIRLGHGVWDIVFTKKA
ncbi:tRNA (guanosine(46)-N7)-methyltransferase TrmB [Sulfuriferula nivalis]|uniref:tRNA (guanine-N(7)-)-methyltransferase n=1 Tax=Sulfuriferula nivalis TaxID=2675298 RepID=A0A809RLB3_9PROT|nr:tRNA (guanosine(46)-N7)-methyltransferase TrmB [Sulfuriferula nivalis]BBO99570.1 tRNA (guanine-N(7)-)-methyltransferase [Sulfuriferula nivalis]